MNLDLDVDVDLDLDVETMDKCRTVVEFEGSNYHFNLLNPEKDPRPPPELSI